MRPPLGGGRQLPAGFTGDQLILGTSGHDTVADDSAGTIAIFGDAGVDSLTGNPVFGAGYGIAHRRRPLDGQQRRPHRHPLGCGDGDGRRHHLRNMVDPKLGANVGGFQSVQSG